MKYLIWTLLLLVGLISKTPTADAQQKTLYLAHLNANNPTSNPTGAMAMAFKAELERKSKAALNVEIFPEGQLGQEKNVTELVRKGIIQSAIVSVGGLAEIYPLIGVLNYPFRFRDLNEVYAVFDGHFGRHMGADITEKTGLVVLGYGDTGGLFVLTNSRHPIHNPTDMAEMKFRTMSLKSHQSFINSLGAEPLLIPWRELYTSLQNGTVEGQMNPASIVKIGNFDRVQKYLTVTNHLYTPYIWICNAEFLNGLSPMEREAVASAARSGVIASRRLAASSNAIRNLAETMEIYRPSNAELKMFQDASQPELERYIRTSLGEEGISMLDIFRTTKPSINDE